MEEEQEVEGGEEEEEVEGDDGDTATRQVNLAFLYLSSLLIKGSTIIGFNIVFSVIVTLSSLTFVEDTNRVFIFWLMAICLRFQYGKKSW